MAQRLNTFLVSLSMLVLVGSAGVVRAQSPGLSFESPEVGKAFAAAMAQFRDERYARALVLFQRVYDQEPHAELLFAMGQASRLSGDCRRAARYYRRFLDTDPSERAARAARDQIESCRAEAQVDVPGAMDRGEVEEEVTEVDEVDEDPVTDLADDAVDDQPDALDGARDEEDRDEEAAGEPVPPTAEVPAPARRGVASPRRETAWYHDTAGNVLMASGLIGVSVGTLLLIDGSRARARTYDALSSQLHRAATRRKMGYVALGVGGALAVSAIVRYALASDDDEVAITAAVTPHGAGSLVLSGRF